LSQLQLTHHQDTVVKHLSYADQRTLELGLALAADSTLLLLDEPTAGMSHSESRHVVKLIRRMTEGKTLLLVEHDMGVVFDLADRIIVLVDGRLVANGTPEAIRSNPIVRAAYLGSDQTEGP
jgi:branched-chain amino acid transport system ATP-binding protein